MEWDVRGIAFGVFTGLFFVSVSAFADTVSGTAGAAFQTWTAANLNESGAPYWNNTSLDGPDMNVGYFLTDAPTAPLAEAPGALPFWGNTFNSVTGTGGSPDLSFYFQKNSSFSIANLQLAVAGNSNINEFGWYNIADPSVLYTIFAGSNSPPGSSDSFTPSAQYGFWFKGDDGTYYTQSSLNPGGDTTHQHFALFEQSSTNGAEVYWLGIEDFNLNEFHGAEGGVGDYNDMLIRIGASPTITAVPEPSTTLLVTSGFLLLMSVRKYRR